MGRYDAYRPPPGHDEIKVWRSPRTQIDFHYRRIDLTEFLIANEGNLPQALAVSMDDASDEMSLNPVVGNIVFNRRVTQQGVVMPLLVEDPADADYETSIPLQRLNVMEVSTLSALILNVDEEVHGVLESFPEEQETGMGSVSDGQTVALSPEPTAGPGPIRIAGGGPGHDSGGNGQPDRERSEHGRVAPSPATQSNGAPHAARADRGQTAPSAR